MFLERVLPQANFYAGTAIVDGRMKQKAFSSVDALRNWTFKSSAMGYNVFFGLSGFNQGYHASPTGELNADGSPRNVFRTHANASYQKAFWLDIDCGEGKPYATQLDAATALKKFMEDTGLPRPVIISSGGGLHLYWIVDQRLCTEKWLAVARRLHALTKHFGLHADPSRTRDPSTVLRVPGTYNYKNEPKEVRIVRDAPNYPTLDIVRTIITKAQELNLTIETPQAPIASPIVALNLTPEQLAVLGMPAQAMETPTKDGRQVVRECQQIREAGMMTEPIWLAMLRTMKYCIDGKLIARELSQQDARYIEADFETKYEYATRLSGGPATCAFLDNERGGVCPTCPHFGKVKSPAELGRELPKQIQLASPMVECMPEQTVTIHPLQDPRFVIKDGDGVYSVEIDENEQRKETKLLDVSFRFLYAQLYQRSFCDQETVYIVQVEEKNKPPRQVRLTSSDAASPASLQKWLFNAQMLTTPGKTKKVIDCMLTYLSQVQRKMMQVKMLDKFGWTESNSEDGTYSLGFVIGDTLYAPQMPPAKIGLSDGLERYSSTRFTTSGTIADWKRIPQFYQENKMMWAQFGICAGFGAVLMRFAPGAAKNGIINFWSRQSGTGKTTLQQVVNSIWGDPDTQMQNLQSTGNSRFMMTGWRHSLPVCINETTGLSDANLSSMLFNLSEGQEKERMGIASRELQTAGTWTTITMMSANNTVMDKMNAYTRSRDAEVRRVLEVEVPMSNVGREEASAMTRIIERNFGLVGREFVQKLLDTGAYKKLETAIDKWVQKHSKSQDERYWENTVASAIIGGRLARQFGLIDFDMDAVEQYALSLIAGMRTGVVSTYTKGADHFSDFLAESLRDTLVVVAEKREGKDQGMELFSDPYIKRVPTGNLNIRAELDTGTVYVRTASLREWCAKHQLPLSDLLKALEEDGKYDPTDGESTKRLSAGVKAITATPARCFKFMLPREEISEDVDE